VVILEVPTSSSRPIPPFKFHPASQDGDKLQGIAVAGFAQLKTWQVWISNCDAVLVLIVLHHIHLKHKKKEKQGDVEKNPHWERGRDYFDDFGPPDRS